MLSDKIKFGRFNCVEFVTWKLWKSNRCDGEIIWKSWKLKLFLEWFECWENIPNDCFRRTWLEYRISVWSVNYSDFDFVELVVACAEFFGQIVFSFRAFRFFAWEIFSTGFSFAKMFHHLKFTTTTEFSGKSLKNTAKSVIWFFKPLLEHNCYYVK